ncbi:Protoheme IX farnesyltransferase [Dirofilaria immitis]
MELKKAAATECPSYIAATFIYAAIAISTLAASGNICINDNRHCSEWSLKSFLALSSLSTLLNLDFVATHSAILLH